MPGSKLAGILHVKELMVNSIHNQAVKKPGKGIEIVAKEYNNVVQAIEYNTEIFIMGVQWHPEYLIQKKVHWRIFKALVRASRYAPPSKKYEPQTVELD